MDSCLPCTPEEEGLIVKKLIEAAESNQQEGNLYHVVSNKWWRNWQEYTGQDTSDCPIDESTGSQQSNMMSQKIRDRPGQIDNSDLVVDGFDGYNNELDLVRTLTKGRDYVLVPQEVWKKLIEWYRGGPSLHRKLISHGSVFNKSFSVEATVRELYGRVGTLFNLEQGKFRLWDYFNHGKHSLLDDFDKTLVYAHLLSDQEILLEVDGFWPSGSSKDSTGNGLALVPIEPSRSPITIAGDLPYLMAIH